MRKPPDVWRLVVEARAGVMPWNSSGLWLNLLRGIVLEADGRDEVQLCLQPFDMFLTLDEQVLEKLPRARIALLEAERDPLLERGQRTRFQLQIPLQHILEVLTDMYIERLVQHRHALQKEESVDQPLGMAHFLERFRIDLLIQTEVPPVLTHGGMQKILVDGCHFPFEDF